MAKKKNIIYTFSIIITLLFSLKIYKSYSSSPPCAMPFSFDSNIRGFVYDNLVNILAINAYPCLYNCDNIKSTGCSCTDMTYENDDVCGSDCNNTGILISNPITSKINNYVLKHFLTHDVIGNQIKNINSNIIYSDGPIYLLNEESFINSLRYSCKIPILGLYYYNITNNDISYILSNECKYANNRIDIYNRVELFYGIFILNNDIYFVYDYGIFLFNRDTNKFSCFNAINESSYIISGVKYLGNSLYISYNYINLLNNSNESKYIKISNNNIYYYPFGVTYTNPFTFEITNDENSILFGSNNILHIINNYSNSNKSFENISFDDEIVQVNNIDNNIFLIAIGKQIPSYLNNNNLSVYVNPFYVNKISGYSNIIVKKLYLYDTQAKSIEIIDINKLLYIDINRDNMNILRDGISIITLENKSLLIKYYYDDDYKYVIYNIKTRNIEPIKYQDENIYLSNTITYVNNDKDIFLYEYGIYNRLYKLNNNYFKAFLNVDINNKSINIID